MTQNPPTAPTTPTTSTTPQQYTAILEDKVIYNPKFTHFSFELKNPPRMSFQAGQYVSFAVDQQGNRRSYSIISNPTIDHGFEILVEPVPGGLGGTYLSQLKFGDEVSLLGPMGIFTIQPGGEEQTLVFVATGVGIAPLRAMILDQLQNRHDSRPIILYWGLRYPGELIWTEDFQNLAKNFPNFSFQPVLSQPSPDWSLSRGHVTDLLKVHNLPPQAGFYVCGNQKMVDDVFQVLKSKGYQENYLHTEKF